MNENRQILLYAIGKAEKAYGVLGYFCIYDDYISIRSIYVEAARLKAKYPETQAVYAIDNRRGLRKEYMQSVREHSIESHAIFKDILEREGLRII